MVCWCDAAKSAQIVTICAPKPPKKPALVHKLRKNSPKKREKPTLWYNVKKGGSLVL
jgi:hypothetical protein